MKREPRTSLNDEIGRREAEASRAYEPVPLAEVRAFYAELARSFDDPRAAPPPPPPAIPIRPIVKPIHVDHAADAIAEINARAESPIERLLGAAIVRGAASFTRIPGLGVGIVNGWVLDVQTNIGRFRPDFELVPTSGPGIVVEADGHAFHERTPEQAAHDRSRDRWMTSQGYRVLRFTGTEINRAAARCAIEIFECMRSMGGRG